LAQHIVEGLYNLALEAVRQGDIEYARKLVREAEELRRSLRMRKPRVLRRGVCRNCQVPLLPGVTAQVRTRRKGRVTKLIIKCEVCGYIHRYHLRRRPS
jgi:ribonuclease P protein subunit RPR2